MIWKEQKATTMAISRQRLTIYLYSAHRAVVFAIAQLSCFPLGLTDCFALSLSVVPGETLDTPILNTWLCPYILHRLWKQAFICPLVGSLGHYFMVLYILELDMGHESIWLDPIQSIKPWKRKNFTRIQESVQHFETMHGVTDVNNNCNKCSIKSVMQVNS